MSHHERSARASPAREPDSRVPSHYLYPSCLFVPPTPHWIVTVLGTCVAVCLWDRTVHRGGMNHFMLPLWNGTGLSTPKYGNVAIRKLIEQLESLGSKRIDLVAKVFGGKTDDQNDPSHYNIGARNSDLAFQVLSDARIDVVASNLGGNFARKILFNTETGEVLLRRHAG